MIDRATADRLRRTGRQEGAKAERDRICAMLRREAAIIAVAAAVRRNQFVRTRRIGSFEPAEGDDA